MPSKIFPAVFILKISFFMCPFEQKTEERADKTSTEGRKSQPFRAESGRKGRQNQHRREKKSALSNRKRQKRQTKLVPEQERVSPFEQKVAEKADKPGTRK